MKFMPKLNYLVETHQAKDHKAARALIVTPKPPKPAPMGMPARLPYVDN